MGQIVNKEFGSDFHICLEKSWLVKKKNDFLRQKNSSFFLSGRSALYTLLKFGIKQHNWKKIYIPSFYCHEVNKYIEELPIQIVTYNYNPFINDQSAFLSIEDSNLNAIINSDYYGLGCLNASSFQNAYIIEDRTHNLGAIKISNAHYVFGSLRKELPVPVGGFLFSSKFKEVPKGKNNRKANQIAIQKLTAMYLKKQYIEGKKNTKEDYRYMFSNSENDLGIKLKEAKIPKVAKAILRELDVNKILKQKKENLKVALKNLKTTKNVQVNNNIKDKGFGLIFQFQTNQNRDALRQYLINESIFPAILWPNQSTKLDIEIENKILFVPIDFRYTKQDILHITDKINMFFQNEKL